MAKKTKGQSKNKTKTIDARKFLEELIGEPLTFGSMIETIRITDEYTLETMSKKLGVSRGHLCDVEKGRRVVSPERAAKWGKALGYGEAHFVALALQAELDAAGLKFRVSLEAA